MDGNQTREGDKVQSGLTGEETVKKVKPDGTRVIQTKEGTLREDQDPAKPVKSAADQDSD